MTGFNLPPGCSVRDIPGNRPENDRYEAFAEALESAFQQHHGALDPVDNLSDEFVEAVYAMMGRAFSEGYSQALADAAQAKHLDDIDQLHELAGASWLGG